MENIAAYLEACTALGVPQNDLFQTVALFENKDMIAVLTNIHSLGRVSQKVEGFAGPYLGAKLASTNRRSFTEGSWRGAQRGDLPRQGLARLRFTARHVRHEQGDCERQPRRARGPGASDATFMGTGSHGCANSTETHLRRQIT